MCFEVMQGSGQQRLSRSMGNRRPIEILRRRRQLKLFADDDVPKLRVYMPQPLLTQGAFEQGLREVLEARDSFEQMAKPVRGLLLCKQGPAVGFQVRCIGAGQPVR
ncbi:hypothetical protein V520_09770 [Pseudomonas putida KG-4]|nr:hypothetical protein V520_09770 [Pseudomonas putida KG-4]